MSDYYFNPIGQITDISLTNNVEDYKKEKKTIDAREESSKAKKNSNRLQMFLWSFIAFISILIMLLFLRLINYND
jgi:uncharacterized membrane protein YvbJ